MYSTSTTTTAVPTMRVTCGRRAALGALRRVLNLLALWRARSRQRRQLMALDDRLLADIGVTRSDAAREWRKPFWRG